MTHDPHTVSPWPRPSRPPKECCTYCFTVGTWLSPQWSDWFEGLQIEPTIEGTSTITGKVCDQAMLFGLLDKIRDLGLPLVAVECLSYKEDRE